MASAVISQFSSSNHAANFLADNRGWRLRKSQAEFNRLFFKIKALETKLQSLTRITKFSDYSPQNVKVGGNSHGELSWNICLLGSHEGKMNYITVLCD